MHPRNAYSAIVITEFPIISEPVKPEQPSNAELAIVVTEFGMSKEPVKPLQYRNAYIPIEVTLEPNDNAFKVG